MFILYLAGLAVFIAMLTRLSLWMSKPKDDEEEHWYGDRERRTRRHNSSPPHRLVAYVEAIGDELHTQRRQQDRHEKRRQLLERIGVAAAIVAAIFAGYSAWIFQGQLDEMRAERRPWVYASNIGIVGPVTHDQQGVHVTISFAMKNIGKLPALHTFPSFLISLHGFAPADKATVCKDAEFGSFGYTVFPDDTFVQPIGRTIRQADIDKTEADAKRWFGNSGGMLFPVVVACIAYQIPGEDRFRHTPYIFTLGMAEDRAKAGCCVVPLDVPSLPVGAVILTTMPNAQFTQAE